MASNTFSVSLSGEQLNDPEAMEAMQAIMDASNKAFVDQVDVICKELGVSEACASDIAYLRTRSRWSEELEKELIRLYKEGIPVNIFEFGN